MDFCGAGRRLRAIRLARGLTQAALAEQVGLSTNYYGAIERGEKIPQMDTMVRICNTLGASMDDVLADQLANGITVSASRLSAELEGLPPADQRYILAAVDAMIRAVKRKTK